MTDRELMQMALDSLRMVNSGTMYPTQREAIKALHDRLAQPEPEPVLWRYRTVTFWDRKPRWRYLESLDGTEGLLSLEPLYTAPPKREWVGLTEEEFKEILSKYNEALPRVVCRAIEAELKEKNA